MNFTCNDIFYCTPALSTDIDIPVLSTMFGVFGALLFGVQLIPQIIVNHHRQNAEGLDVPMMLSWAVAGLTLAVYGIMRDLQIALQIQAHLLVAFSLISWVQCMAYRTTWSAKKSIAVLLGAVSASMATETALILYFKTREEDSSHRPYTLLAVIAAGSLAAGAFRHLCDIWKHQTIRGVNFTFVGLDAAGDLSSMLAIIFCSPIDSVALSIYAAELAMWALVLLCGSFMSASSKLNVSSVGPEAIPLVAQTEGQSTSTLRSRQRMFAARSYSAFSTAGPWMT